MKKILEHKKEIIISLGTSAVFFYIQPILEYLGNLFLKTCILASDKFSKSYYSSIAQNDTTAFSELNNLILLYILLIIFSSFIFYLTIAKKKLRRNAGNLLQSIIDKKETIQGIGEKVNTEKNFTTEELISEKIRLLKDLAKLEVNASQLKDSSFKRDNNIIFFTITAITFAILLFTNFFKTVAVTQQNLIFKNDIIKISPFVQDSTLKILKSEWVRSENVNDFNKIKGKVRTIKENLNIK
jgi:hypothetical protein